MESCVTATIGVGVRLVRHSVPLGLLEEAQRYPSQKDKNNRSTGEPTEPNQVLNWFWMSFTRAKLRPNCPSVPR